ncbi:MAG: AI-2E family transporter [Lachnospiraceae bacterium]|jgi:predicted PurR-regulated permease PerM|nr:AI-2E family transporter [Lachnospiraceae bacterium]
MNLNRETMRKLMLLIAFTILLLVGVQRLDAVFGALRFLWGIGFPFALGGAIAFILNVPMTALEQWLFPREKTAKSKLKNKLARPFSLVLAIVLVVGVISLVMFVVVPELGTTVASLGASMEAFLPRAQEWLENIFSSNEQIVAWIEGLEMNWEKIVETAWNFFRSGAGSVLSSTMTVARTIISAVTNFFIGFVFACYVLLQKEKLGEQSRKLMQAIFPRKQVDYILHVCSLSHRTFSSFITGQCMEAVILGAMFFVAMSVLRFPYALLVGVLVAFTALIPIFGAFIGCVVGAFLILMVNPAQALGFIVLFQVLQQIEGNLIYPRVVGNSVGLPAIWVLVAVTVGGNLMGIVGMLIFIPMASVLYTLLREWMYGRLDRKKQQEKAGK